MAKVNSGAGVSRKSGNVQTVKNFRGTKVVKVAIRKPSKKFVPDF